MRHHIYTFCLSFLLLCVAQCVAAKDFVVVIDPGHGGKDAGAVGKNTTEKSINLKVGLKLRSLLRDNMGDVKVEMTRDNDKFVSLQDRANFANRKHADLFVSIHANSISSKSPAHRTVNGASVYTLGLDRSETNLSVAMRENEVMKLESDYSTTYQGFDPSSTESYIAFEMMQHKNMDQSIALAEAVQNQLVHTAGRANKGVRQAPFWVLVRSSMPSILVELDFICNPDMERFMASDDGSTKLARAIYNGISRYRSSSGSPAVPKATPRDAVEQEEQPTADVSTQEESSTVNTGEVVYRIQFLTAVKPFKKGDKRLKGLDADYYTDGGIVKYVTGCYSSMADANRNLRKVKDKFPDAFVIKMCDGKRVK